MSLSVCIPDLIEQGKLKGEKAERAKALYSGLLAQYEGKFGRAAAESMATTKVIAALEAEVAHKKLVAGLTAKAQSNWLGAMRAAAGGKDAAFDPFLARSKLVPRRARNLAIAKTLSPCTISAAAEALLSRALTTLQILPRTEPR